MARNTRRKLRYHKRKTMKGGVWNPFKSCMGSSCVVEQPDPLPLQVNPMLPTKKTPTNIPKEVSENSAGAAAGAAAAKGNSFFAQAKRGELKRPSRVSQEALNAIANFKQGQEQAASAAAGVQKVQNILATPLGEKTDETLVIEYTQKIAELEAKMKEMIAQGKKKEEILPVMSRKLQTQEYLKRAQARIARKEQLQQRLRGLGKSGGRRRSKKVNRKYK